MAINKKLIVFKKEENFKKELEASNILPSSWVVIKDAKKLYVQDTEIEGVNWDKVEALIEDKLTAENISIDEIKVSDEFNEYAITSDNVQDALQEFLQIILDNEAVVAMAISTLKDILGIENDELNDVTFKGSYIEGENTFKGAIEALNDALEENVSTYDDTELKNEIQNLKENKVDKSEYTKITDGTDVIKEIQIIDEDNEEAVEVYSKAQCDERFALKGEVGSNYDDTEIKNRLTALEGKEEYDDSELKQDIQDLKTNKADKSELSEYAKKSDIPTSLEAENVTLSEVSIDDVKLEATNVQEGIKELMQNILDDEAVKAEAIKALKDLIGDKVNDDLTITFKGNYIEGEETVEGAIEALDDAIAEVKDEIPNVDNLATKEELSSYATKDEIPTDYLKVWQGSQEQYEKLGEYEDNVIYIIL